jgi:putative drug exporter of the RND superfamily
MASRATLLEGIGMFAAIGRGVTRRPWLVIASWAVVAAAVIATAPKLADVTNSDQSAFLPGNAESARAAALVSTAFPGAHGATAVIVVKRADGAALTAADTGTVSGLADRLNAARPTGVQGVVFDAAQSVAPNKRIALLATQFSGAAEERSVQDAVATVRDRTATALKGSGLTAGMTGQAAIVVDNKHAFAAAEKIVTVVTLGLIVALLLLIFRSPIAALLPLLSVGLVFGLSTALVAAAGKAFHVQVGQELPTMLTVVLFGIGTDYILFLLFRYRERLRAGDDPRTAIVAAVERVGEAIFSAAFAVIAAFGALVLATLGFFATLGPALAIGVAVMLLAALTLVPAVVAVLGRRVFWPSRSAARRPTGTRFARVGRFVARRPVAVVVASVALLGGLAAGALAYHPDYDPIGQLPEKTAATRAYADLKEGFPPGALNPTDVYLRSSGAPLDQATVAAFVGRLSAVPGVAGPMPPRVSADGRVVEVPLVLKLDPYGGAALDLVSGPLRSAAREAAPPGTSVVVGGQTMAFADVRDATNRDLALIFPVAGALFVLILAGLLRAPVAPVYLVGMVVLGFAATLGAATALFQGALGRPGLAFSIPIILYLFVTAIGTDYNILITARLREEIREGSPPRLAAARAIEHAGPSVAAAAIILAGTFGALLVSGVPFFVEIGFAVTLGIVLVAFVVSVLLVPAVTALVGRVAWWPGHRDRSGVGAGRDAELVDA